MRAMVSEDFLKKLENKYQLSEQITYDPSADDYYKPKGPSKEFDPNKKTLRIRDFGPGEDAKILLDKIEYKAGLKKSVYGEKVVLFKGPKDTARDILDTLGFEYWFTIKKLWGKKYNIKDEKSNLDFVFYLENIEGIGNTIEVEFKTDGAEVDAEKIADFLGIEKKNIINKNMASFIVERRGIS